jgi:MoaA/NifB/PqqE/SkfB family radical SAM enzyme
MTKCRDRRIRFDMRPKVKTDILDDYYTPGTALAGRCLYPFLYARVSFSGKAYFCPFIRVEVGDLSTQTLEEVWTGERYVGLRQRLVDEGLFPVCRRCCKVELTGVPVDPELEALATR